MNISQDIPLTAAMARLLIQTTVEDARNYLGVVNDKRYVHTQGVESDTWSITHNLNYQYPDVRVFIGEKEIHGDVVYTDANNIQISFLGPVAGVATIN